MIYPQRRLEEEPPLQDHGDIHIEVKLHFPPTRREIISGEVVMGL